jgi:hypothetical protein
MTLMTFKDAFLCRFEMRTHLTVEGDERGKRKSKYIYKEEA